MTNMGETMGAMQETAERVIAALGALVQPDLKTDVENLQAAVKGTGNGELIASIAILGRLSAAYGEIEELILPSILAAENAQHHALHWRG